MTTQHTQGVCEQCRCRAHSAPALSGVTLCPLHQAAAETKASHDRLLEELVDIKETADTEIGGEDITQEPWATLSAIRYIARAAIAKATGGKP